MSRKKPSCAGGACDPAGGRRGAASRQEGPCIPGKKRKGRAKITVLDIFAGAGGFSTGAEAAGAHVLFCINHYEPAVSVHARNHPYAMHCHEDVFAFNWNRAPLADVILASPSCKCHSTAATKGGKGKRGAAPNHDVLRATPWAVLNCLENQLDRGNEPIVVIENVVEFKDIWRLYKGYIGMFRELGYSVSVNTLCALDFGVPQRRTRLFLIMTPSDKPFDLRAPDNRKCPASVRSLKARDRLPFRPLVDLGPGSPPQAWTPAGDWSPASVGLKAVEREKRLAKRLGKAPKEWMWANTDTSPLSLEEPIGTITAKSGNQWYLMKRTRGELLMRPFSVHELRGAMGFPKGYMLPDSVAESGVLLGNAVVPAMSEFIMRQLIARA